MMEEKLRSLFDFQRFEKNPRLESIISQTAGKQAVELSDEMLLLVNAAGEPEIQNSKATPLGE